jgi:hypothetical protein
MKSVLLFFATFVLGAALAFAVRTALHRPYAAPTAAASHAGHSSAAPADAAPRPGSSASAAPVVNTVCAVCGMDVDPGIEPAAYQGKLVGFGCAACPPKFAREPDRYGPSALRNEVAKN